jgi:MerR family transcriptional regulator, mercuric resistance operon regulatory protein
MPRARKTSGPTQQAEAPIAASIPAIRNRFPLRVVSFGSDISSETELKLRTIVRNQGGIFNVPKLTIGGVAASAGINVETIRYYQRRGLLEEPKKPLGGYRNYPTEMVRRIRFIKRAQALGFTLEDVAGLLQLDNRGACAATREVATQKVALIQHKLFQLGAMRDALAKLVRQCDKKVKSSTCPIIEILQRDSESQASCQQIKRPITKQINKTSPPILGESPVAKFARVKRRTASD